MSLVTPLLRNRGGGAKKLTVSMNGRPSPHPGPLPSHPMGAERESAFAKAAVDRQQANGCCRSNARQDAAAVASSREINRQA